MPDRWHSPEGYSVNALYGYIQFLLQFLTTTKAQRVACAFDESLGSCFRNEIYSDYKSSRALPDEELAFQLSACKSFTDIMGISTQASTRYEADDIIATLAQLVRKHDSGVCIVTRDKDLGQLLLAEEDSWWDFAADKHINRRHFTDHFGVLPEQLADYLSLVGDPVDDVPGVPGIGAKTATCLLQHFGSLQRLYQNLDEVSALPIRGAKGLGEKLRGFKSQIEMARRLVCLHSTVPLSVGWDNLCWQPPQKETVRLFLKEFGLPQRFDRQLWW